ncbi:MAG: hypothetical protein VCD31_15320, partial [Alphaproteobacteria bacterium]
EQAHPQFGEVNFLRSISKKGPGSGSFGCLNDIKTDGGQRPPWFAASSIWPVLPPLQKKTEVEKV